MEKECEKAWKKRKQKIEGKMYPVEYLACREIRCQKLNTCECLEAYAERACNSILGIVNKAAKKRGKRK